MARKTNIFLAIGLILVAVLAGCSSEAPTPQIPSNVEIRQTEVFQEGDTYTSDNFTVWVKYLYQSDYKQIEDAELVFVKGDTNTRKNIVEMGDMVTTTVGTDINSKPVTDTITINVTPAPVSTEIESVAFNTVDFKLGKLDYTGAADLPEVITSMVTLTVDGEEMTAEAAGLELAYVNAKTHAEFDETSNPEYFLLADGSNADIALKVEWGEGKVAYSSELEVDSNTKLVVKYNGEGIVSGTGVTEENIGDFDVYLYVNGSYELVEDYEAADFYFASTANASSTGEKAISDTNKYAGINYKGVTSIERAAIEVIPATEYGTTVVLELNSDFKLYKQIYNSDIDTLLASAVKSASITIDGEATDITDEVTLTWASTASGDAYTVAADKNRNDLSSVDNLYVKATYKTAAGTEITNTVSEAVINTEDPVITEVTIAESYTNMYNSKPMLTSPITWTVTGKTADGTVDLSEETTKLTWYVNGASGTKPAALAAVAEAAVTTDNRGASIGVVYDNKVYSNAVTLNAQPQGYYVFNNTYPASTDISLNENSTDQFWIGMVASSDPSDYVLDAESYTYIAGYEGDTALTGNGMVPTITAVDANKFKALTATASDNKVNLTIKYFGENGLETEDVKVDDYQITAKAWVKTPVLKAGTVEVSADAEAPTKVTQGTANTLSMSDSDMEGIVADDAFTYAIETVGEHSSDPKLEEGQLTLWNNCTVKITVTYPVSGGKTATADFFVTTK